jgi:DNA-binding MarR family transcriptional regulator
MQELSQPAVLARPVLLALMRAERVQRRRFGGRLFAEPAWDMLLDLLESRISGKPMAVSSLCIAADVPPTTALRRIEELERAGYVMRRQDPLDGRRSFVALTDSAYKRLMEYFVVLDRNIRCYLLADQSDAAQAAAMSLPIPTPMPAPGPTPGLDTAPASIRSVDAILGGLA